MNEEFIECELLPSDECVEIQCEHCAHSCFSQTTSCLYEKPPVMHPTQCPLNKW